MSKISNEKWVTIFKIIVAVATAILGAIGAQGIQRLPGK